MGRLDDYLQNRKLLAAYQRNRDVLKVQIAEHGRLNAPTHKINEEYELDEKIQKIEEEIREAKINFIESIDSYINMIDHNSDFDDISFDIDRNRFAEIIASADKKSTSIVFADDMHGYFASNLSLFILGNYPIVLPMLIDMREVGFIDKHEAEDFFIGRIRWSIGIDDLREIKCIINSGIYNNERIYEHDKKFVCIFYNMNHMDSFDISYPVLRSYLKTRNIRHIFAFADFISIHASVNKKDIFIITAEDRIQSKLVSQHVQDIAPIEVKLLPDEESQVNTFGNEF